MSSSHFYIMCLIMISLVPLHQLGDACSLEAQVRQCLPVECSLPRVGRYCACCLEGEKTLKCWVKKEECMAACKKLPAR
ncbi:hypothetical protein Bca4012_067631 [Brassica carinata]